MKSWFQKFAFLMLVLLAPGIAQADAPLAIDGTTTVDAQKVIELIQSGVPLIDSRKQKDFDSGHIEGAIHLVSTDTNEETLAQHIKSKDSPVIFYCNGLKCGRAADACNTALTIGYTNIYYYAKGLEEWKELGLPVVQ